MDKSKRKLFFFFFWFHGPPTGQFLGKFMYDFGVWYGGKNIGVGIHMFYLVYIGLKHRIDGHV